MKERTGIITDLQRFSLYDGPGIRTTVFLKGCPLRCQWCHNPECLFPSPQLRYVSARCAQCGRCGQVCVQGVHDWSQGRHTVNWHRCKQCGACVQACPAEALSLTGRRVSAGEIIATALRDRDYYDRSGGGLTVSGGEPFLQPDFLEALLTLAKENGIATAVETCGFWPRDALARIAPLTDLFLFDYKETDPLLHQRFTGQDNRLILENLDALLARGSKVTLRCPLIPGYNLRTEHLEGIAALTKRYPTLAGCELMAYHKLGAPKYGELGMDYGLTEVQELTPERKADILQWLNARAEWAVQWG